MHCSVKLKVEISDSGVDFDKVCIGESVTKKIVLKNIGALGTRFQITKVSMFIDVVLFLLSIGTVYFIDVCAYASPNMFVHICMHAYSMCAYNIMYIRMVYKSCLCMYIRTYVLTVCTYVHVCIRMCVYMFHKCCIRVYVFRMYVYVYCVCVCAANLHTYSMSICTICM